MQVSERSASQNDTANVRNNATLRAPRYDPKVWINLPRLMHLTVWPTKILLVAERWKLPSSTTLLSLYSTYAPSPRNPRGPRISAHIPMLYFRNCNNHRSANFFPCVLRKTHLFCKGAYRPFKVIQARSLILSKLFWYQSKARMRLLISPS